MSNKSLLTALFALLCCSWMWAQAPSVLNVEGKEYPKVNPDRSVTFQFRAPTAKAVTDAGFNLSLSAPTKTAPSITMAIVIQQGLLLATSLVPSLVTMPFLTSSKRIWNSMM